MCMPFGEDLLASVRLLYRYTELVCARHAPNVGEIHDMRISSLILASEKVQSALRGLQSHFPDRMRSSLEKIDHIATYLHRSFTAALHYKRPYSSNNPYGIALDYAYMSTKAERLVVEKFQHTIPALFKLVTMGMLLVHHFVLELTMLACAMSDYMYEEQVLDFETRDKFTALMREIKEYMTQEEAGLSLAMEVAGVASSSAHARMTEYRKKYNLMNFTDIKFTMTELKEMFDASNDYQSMLCIRLVYYQFIIESLDRYGAIDMAKNRELALHTDNPETYFLKEHALNLFETRRHFEDQNLRKTLLERFMGTTQNPVYRYATLPYTGDADTGQLVMQNQGGTISMLPRVRVHVWRKKTEWTDDTWKMFALVHGEAALMQDLMYNLVPVLLANQTYRLTEQVAPDYLHMMLTRVLGPQDINTLFSSESSGNCDTGYLKAMAHVHTELESLRDPAIPAAISIQPMPDALKQWTLDVYKNFDEHSAFKYIPSNAVVHRPTSINLNDMLRNGNIDPLSQNVVWNQSVMPSEYWLHDASYGLNSIFFVNYGNVLSSIPTLQEQKVVESANLNVTFTQYETWHKSPPWSKKLAVVYPTTRALQSIIKLKLTEFSDKFPKRPAPFLDPRSWVTKTEVDDTTLRWEKCEHSFDLNKGTYITFAPMAGAAPGVTSDTDKHVEKAITHTRTHDNKASALTSTTTYAHTRKDLT